MPLSIEELQQPPFHHEMIFVEGGTFMMGSDDDQAFHEEKPVHEVRICSFKIAKYPVTQAFWEKLMGNNPSHFKGGSRPVEMIAWEETQLFIEKLNQMTGGHYRLPTEAEWEYAARGGAKSEGYRFAGSNELEEVAWYKDNCTEPQPVGLKMANELGLHDMCGNVWEWCQDQQVNDHYHNAPTDGSAQEVWDDVDCPRIYRGGCWMNHPRICRPTWRGAGYPSGNKYLGFRLASTLF